MKNAGHKMREIYSYFKFVSNRRNDVLKSGMIRFSPIGDFNDPFELEPVISPISREFIAHISGLSEVERAKLEMTQEDWQYSHERDEMLPLYRDKYREAVGQYGVLSLSGNYSANTLISVCMPDRNEPRSNILMWSHYANSHNGFVIEFAKDFLQDVELKRVE